MRALALEVRCPTCPEKRTSAAKSRFVLRKFTARLNPCPSLRPFASFSRALRVAVSPRACGSPKVSEGVFHCAVNSRRLTASAPEVRFSRATGAKSSLSRLSFLQGNSRTCCHLCGSRSTGPTRFGSAKLSSRQSTSYIVKK